MTKRVFLTKLETKLSSLDQEKRNRILKKYESIIDEEKKSGKLEKDIIADLGNVDVIAKIYLDEEKVTDQSKEKASEKMEDNTFTKTSDKVFNYIDNIFKDVDGTLAKRILEILCFIFIGMVFIMLLKIPFALLEAFGRGIFFFDFISNPFNRVFRVTWSLVINIAFFAICIWFIVYYARQIINRYGNGVKREKHIAKSMTNTVNTVKEAKKEESEREYNVAFDIVFLILKIIIVLFTIPLILLNMGLVIALVLLFMLFPFGVFLIGPILFIIGLIIMVGLVIDLIYTSVFKGGIK